MKILVSVRSHSRVVVKLVPRWWRRLLGEHTQQLEYRRNAFGGWVVGGELAGTAVARAIERAFELERDDWPIATPN